MTPQQWAFVATFTLMRNATRAAVAAGYSARTAATAGAKLRRHPEVAAALSRLRKATTMPSGEALTPLDYLLSVMRDPDASLPRRIRAAAVAARYCHPQASVGKKDRQQEAARKVSGGKYAAPAVPLKLVLPEKP